MTQKAPDQFDRLAYHFWSIHPRDLPKAIGMPEGYPGGKRAWFYAEEMRYHALALVAEALEPWVDLRDESLGVTGFHLNGDEATWDEFDLPELAADAQAALERVKQEARNEALKEAAAEWTRTMSDYDEGYEELEAENARLVSDLKKLWIALTTYKTKVQEYASDDWARSDHAYDWLHDDAGQTAHAALQDTASFINHGGPER